jgi:hypothetical protein
MTHLRLHWGPVLRAGWVITILLSALSVAFYYAAEVLQLRYTWSVSRKVTVDAEGTLPAWFSSALIGACAFVLLAIGALERARGGRFARHWGALGALFVVLSAEEVVDFHTIPVFPDRVWVAVRDTLGAPWLLLGIPFVLAFAVVNLRFLQALPRRTRNGLIVAGAVYVGGSVVVEAIEVVHYFRQGYNWAMVAMVTLEEWMEMAGMLLLLGALLDYVHDQFPMITVTLRQPDAEPANRDLGRRSGEAASSGVRAEDACESRAL